MNKEWKEFFESLGICRKDTEVQDLTDRGDSTRVIEPRNDLTSVKASESGSNISKVSMASSSDEK